MAKKSMIVKANRKPKYKVREYTRCSRCGRPHAVMSKFGICRICFRELAYKGQIPDRKSTRLNSSHPSRSRMPSSA